MIESDTVQTILSYSFTHFLFQDIEVQGCGSICVLFNLCALLGMCPLLLYVINISHEKLL
jgi:hypothetical protein